MSHQFRTSNPRRIAPGFRLVERCGDGTYLCPTCAAKSHRREATGKYPPPNPYPIVKPIPIVYTNNVPDGYASALKAQKEAK